MIEFLRFLSAYLAILYQMLAQMIGPTPVLRPPPPTPRVAATVSATPTTAPSLTPTLEPTMTATAPPSSTATAVPTATATFTPTHSPVPTPSATRTATGTATPTASATSSPTLTPTASPSHTATRTPTSTATASATASSSSTPTQTPTATAVPTASATAVPTATPSPIPTATPSAIPTSTPTAIPTATASATPSASATPTFTAVPAPTNTPPQAVQDPTGFQVAGVPPAQKLPAALVVYPLVQTSATVETRLELVNLSNLSVSVYCFYVTSVTCNELGFRLALTPQQPVSWLASTGLNGGGIRLAPPFTGEGELKCVVATQSGDPAAHNVLQGRAIVTDTNLQTVGYNANAFRRLSPGPYTGAIRLDGIQYESCPDRLHFQALTSQSGSDSELVLVPCSEDLLNQVAASTAVQFAVINEWENSFSGSIPLNCYSRRRFSTIPPLRRSTAGTETVHAIVRGVDVPVIGLVIDRFTVPGSGALSSSSNLPYLEGARSATIDLP